MNKKITKLGKAVAGSALLVGATLTGAAGLASAADGSQDLGDYPTPFVDQDGEVASTIVVGDSAKTVDVVGAINVAGSLGNAAFAQEDVSTGSSAGAWSASNGVALDTVNENLYFGDSIDQIRNTLVEGDLDALDSATFVDDVGEETRVDYYLNVGDGLTSQFGTTSEMEDDEDPVQYIGLPASVGSASDAHVYNLQANFGDSLNFTDSAVAGEDIELFGETYTVSEDMTSGQSELVLWGSAEELNLQTGESSTFTVNGEEHTVEVRYIDSGTVTLRVDGSPEKVDEGNSFIVDGQDVRVSGLYPEGDGEGLAQFQIGSDEVVLEDGSAIEADGETVEGTHVEFNGDTGGNVNSISSIDVYVGPEEQENDRIEAGETFSHSFFQDVEVQFEGLNPDAASDEVGEVEVDTNGNENARVSFGDTTFTFAHSEDDANGDLTLADADNDAVHTYEGATVAKNEYLTSDAGDFDHMWEVTSVDVPTAGNDGNTAEEGTVVLEDVVTGSTVEVELDETDTGTDNYQSKEIIDGHSYYFQVDQSDGTEDDVEVTWGNNADFGNTGATTSVYTAVDTDSGASLTFTSAVDVSSVELPNAGEAGVTESDFNSDGTVAGTVTGENEGDFQASVNGGQASTAHVVLYDGNQDKIGEADVGTSLTNVTADDGSTVENIEVTSADGTVTSADVQSGAGTNSATYDDGNGGNLVKTVAADAVALPSTDSTDSQYAQASYDSTTATVSASDLEGDSDFTAGALDYSYSGQTLSLADAQTNTDNNGNSVALATVLPEDNNDQESAYVVSPDVDGNNEIEVEDPVGAASLVGLQSQDNVDVGYDSYGTYVEYDSDNAGVVSLNIPAVQATVGAAVTGADGSVSAEGSAGSVTTQTPTGFPDAAALDSDSNVESLKTSDELILVGGPAVNALTQELADEGKTQAASDYSEGSAVVELVNDAFAEGQDALVVAGYSGDDTREAANYVSNYADNADDLAGQTQVELSTQQTQSAE